MAKKNPTSTMLIGFKSILFGRLEETVLTISTAHTAVCFPFVMPDISQTYDQASDLMLIGIIPELTSTPIGS